MESDQATVIYDSQIIAGRHKHNKLGIVTNEKETVRCLLIDLAIPSDYNIQKKTTEKMSKYIDLQIECEECRVRR